MMVKACQYVKHIIFHIDITILIVNNNNNCVVKFVIQEDPLEADYRIL